MENTITKNNQMTPEQQREQIILAIGMLEGASWMELSKQTTPEMLDSIASMLRKAIGLEVIK